MKRKTSDILVLCAIMLLLIYANYYGIMNHYISGLMQDLYMAVAVMIGLSPCFFKKIKIKKKIEPCLFLWGLFLVLIIFNRNQDIAHGTYIFVFRIISGILIIFMSLFGKKWTDSSTTLIYKIGYLNVIATFLFLILPSLYSIMISFYGGYPTGTNGGTQGYRAGIANHYSQNATYIAFVFLALTAIIMYQYLELKKYKRWYLLLWGMSFVGLFLTSKRAHLMFTVLSISIVYLICKPQKIHSRWFKATIAGVGLIGIVYIMSFFVEPVAYFLDRISTIGIDSESLARLKMWALAFGLFEKNPILGIGWGGYKYQYASNLYQYWQDSSFMYLNAHNVYVQVLAESGIIGFTIYMLSAIKSLMVSITLLRKHGDLIPQQRIVIYMSTLFQIFVLLYNLTGNTLYDYTIYFYAVAVSASFCIYMNVEEAEKTFVVNKYIE